MAAGAGAAVIAEEVGLWDKVKTWVASVLGIESAVTVGDMIPGSLKHSPSYHGELAGWSLEDLEKAAKQTLDRELRKKARDMLKLIK